MSPVYVWIVAGSLLCLLEVVFPVDFVAVIMGVSAVITAAIAMVIPSFTIQAASWLILSVLFIALSRRFLPVSSGKTRLKDAVEGECLTVIPAGKTGRVLYEGNSWRAECQDPELTIAGGEKVYIVGRQGNTLLVYPVNALQGQPGQIIPKPENFQ